MKKLFLIVATLVITAGVFASTPTGAKYMCTKCEYSSTKPGKCPHCKVALVKEGSYYCTKCEGVTSAKAGKCPKCGGTMVKMEAKKNTDKKTM